MTPEEKRQLRNEGKLIVEKRSAALRQALRMATPNVSLSGFRTEKANEQWLSEHMEYMPAAEVAKRFVVTPAEELGWPSPFVECLNCHDVLYTYPRESKQCSCGGLTVTFPKRRRGRPPKVLARDDKARNVVLTAKSY
jgi:hypothetical protein